MTISFGHNGRRVTVDDAGRSLLEVLRDDLGDRSVKDGCSPQGQCGCCTVLVDGAPRVACVTPARRVADRKVTTLDGLDESTRAGWAAAFLACGASQCGFCTPGIVVRLEGLRRKDPEAGPVAVDRALAAHLCRCTGWRTILEAWAAGPAGAAGPTDRDLDAAARRATLEGGAPQHVGPSVVLGSGGFADDSAPPDALVAVPAGDGWAVAETLDAARRASGKVQGRRSTVEVVPPLEVPEGPWDRVLRTSWVEPAYLEPDASWCRPGEEPASPLANGGAFGGKRATAVAEVARRLADEHGRPVRVVLSREDVVDRGPKRPPIAAGIRTDGTGVLRVVRTPGIVEAVATVAPGLVVEEVDAPGPPTSAALRAAGWAEAAVLLAAVGGPDAPVRSPAGARAWASIAPDGTVRVRVACGEALDPVVLRSYVIGAAHMALGWVCTEGLAVDETGAVHSRTVRSFGVLRAGDTPPIEVEIDDDGGAPVNGSDAAFVAVAAAVWRSQGFPECWPTGTPPAVPEQGAIP